MIGGEGLGRFLDASVLVTFLEGMNLDLRS
jgi:hypothetical protein